MNEPACCSLHHSPAERAKRALRHAEDLAFADSEEGKAFYAALAVRKREIEESHTLEQLKQGASRLHDMLQRTRQVK